MEFRLPPLTLQPIAENAVKHGIRQEHALLRIVIRTRRTAEGSQVVIEDNWPGFASRGAEEGAPPEGERTQEAGVGLNNVRGRLELLCGGSLDLAPRPGGGAVVTVSIPDRPLFHGGEG